MMMAVIGKKDYAIGYDTLNRIGCEVKITHFRNCNKQCTCRFDNDFLEEEGIERGPANSPHLNPIEMLNIPIAETAETNCTPGFTTIQTLLVCASSSRTHGQQCHNRDLRIFNL
jgi:hypothetical protein